MTEPLEVIVLPQGKSLDVCMQMKEKAETQDQSKREKRLKAKKAARDAKIAEGYHRDPTPQEKLFDFINSKIFQTNKPSSKPSDRENLRASTTQDLNVSSFKVAEDLRKA